MEFTPGNNEEKIDLSLVATNDLIAELFKRHDAAIFAGKIFKTMHQYSVTKRFHGHRDPCIAMCANLMHIINDIEIKSTGPLIE